MSIATRDLRTMTAADNAIVESVYSQMEHHLTQQCLLLHQQKREIIELKRKPYIASMREKTTELALLDALQHKERLERQLSEQDSLLECLKENLTDEDQEGALEHMVSAGYDTDVRSRLVLDCCTISVR